MFEGRMAALRAELERAGIDVALITDDDSVYYYTGYYDYLHMEFGRPSILAVSAQGSSLLITPSMEKNMADAAARVDRIAYWLDGAGKEWREELPGILAAAKNVAIEPDRMPPVVRTFVESLVDSGKLQSVTPIIEQMRMVKSDEELKLARHAGQVATVMMDAAAHAIGDGVAEYEVALAVSTAGTHKAAELLNSHYDDACMSPNTHFLQIMASGDEIAKPHHRASIRIMRRGEPVFMCFCGMTNFHRFKLGFDRTFWIGEMSDEKHARVYQTALDSQQAALAVLRPGVTAEEVHATYAEIIQTAGYEFPFRCGRATGFSFLERPELVFGDRTVLQPGMVLAVDGSVTLDARFRAQVGDSFIVTEDGYEQITHHSKDLADVVLPSGG
ncbi:MAG: aminopeptidase P family protein [Hyphomicrobiales bacterium]|nr:aminopeptidase P family protein [Hyphomicrobiales bacterium]MCP5002085.1 aminopeptidase P family protein [Hyphomicrobiales bacterium]